MALMTRYNGGARSVAQPPIRGVPFTQGGAGASFGALPPPPAPAQPRQQQSGLGSFSNIAGMGLQAHQMGLIPGLSSAAPTGTLSGASSLPAGMSGGTGPLTLLGGSGGSSAAPGLAAGAMSIPSLFGAAGTAAGAGGAAATGAGLGLGASAAGAAAAGTAAGAGGAAAGGAAAGGLLGGGGAAAAAPLAAMGPVGWAIGAALLIGGLIAANRS